MHHKATNQHIFQKLEDQSEENPVFGSSLPKCEREGGNAFYSPLPSQKYPEIIKMLISSMN